MSVVFTGLNIFILHWKFNFGGFGLRRIKWQRISSVVGVLLVSPPDPGLQTGPASSICLALAGDCLGGPPC